MEVMFIVVSGGRCWGYKHLASVKRRCQAIPADVPVEVYSRRSDSGRSWLKMPSCFIESLRREQRCSS